MRPGPVGYAELAGWLRGRAPTGPSVLIAIDGWGAAGKSTLAGRLATALGGAPVVHTDDVASHDTPLDWWPLLEEWVLAPLAAGRAGALHRYDWNLRRRTDRIVVPPWPVVLIEGVSAGRRAIRDRLGALIWVQAGDALRRHRALERDGPAQAAYWETWRAEEAAFYAVDPVAEAADLVVAGAGEPGIDPQRAVRLLSVRTADGPASPG